ncbi:hypothetical protein A1O3_03578 [Capronia epimyces CBS 606.96]|uniref:Major facilitator superfamily (MFS) profile domain-containing protein n=1 Tax=Capronia epimyces CBS 606.96 TaxID=1182542 RepID=W9YAE5_9EURO|nr:uncharacterized protein A1O3_03578 [Capronia epimyces CBS 606.96]EXJ86625.1 hypothetical protein A1O3_03578 [Capronia epimyces CBS 606.96]
MLPFLIYCLAVGAVAVPKINIILALMCLKSRPGDTDRNWKNISRGEICTDPTVYAEMGWFVGCGNLLSGILCAVSSPCLGAWSDRYGRKPFIAFSALGMFCGDVISVVAAWFPNRISVYWILLEFVIGGLTGAFLTIIALTQSYITDITPAEKRAKVFSLLHAYLCLGLALGPAAGAFLVRMIHNGDMLSVFYVAGACHALFISYVLVGIPESLPAPSIQPGDKPSFPDTWPVSRKLKNVFLCRMMPLSVLGSLPLTALAGAQNNLATLAAIDALSFGVQIGLPALLVLLSEYHLQWTNLEANLFISATNMTRATILAIFLPTAIKLMSSTSSKPGPSVKAPPSSPSLLRLSMRIIRPCILLVDLSNIGFVISRTSLPFTLSGIASAAGAPVSPLVQSSMTIYVTPDRIGELFGAISLLHSLSRALVPALMQFVYSLTLRTAPEALFLGLGILFGIVFLVTF